MRGTPWNFCKTLTFNEAWGFVLFLFFPSPKAIAINP